MKLNDSSIPTLQYALKRGIETTFQLEESELAAEPLPDREARSAILFYESAEGGAGVLTRLASDMSSAKVVARQALQVCHFHSVSGEWNGIADLENTNAECEAGCYRCLLSYFNQVDHNSLDRQDEAVVNLLYPAQSLHRHERQSWKERRCIVPGVNESVDFIA